MSIRRVALASAALLTTAAPVMAQQRQAPMFTIEGAANFQALRGNVFSDLNDGRGASQTRAMRRHSPASLLD